MSERYPVQARTSHRPWLRLAVVTETYPPEVNGVARTVHALLTAMSMRGHRVELVRPRQNRGEQADAEAGLYRCLLVPGLPVPGYAGLHMGLPVGGRLRRLWAESPPDVIYVATEGPLGWSVIRLAGRLGIPVVSGFHTNFHSYSRHYRLGLLQRVIHGYLRGLHNRTERTLVPTVELRDQLLEQGFQRVAVMGRGVDSELFSPQRRDRELRRSWGLEDGDLAAIHVGRLAAEKNLPLLLESYEAARRVNPRLRLVLVGDGPLYRELERDQRGIILCGMQRGAALAAHYASGDLFLFPSETETYGNVVAEAMASGLATVAYDYAAAHLLIEHGHNGLLAPLGDRDEFIAASMQAVQCSPDTLRRLRLNARERALDYRWEAVLDRFEDLLFECAKGSHDYGDEPQPCADQARG